MTKKYVNPHQKRIYRGSIHFLLWQLGYYKDPKPQPIPKGFSFPNPSEPVDENRPKVTWVNHSTFWVQALGKSILMDPIWNTRCSPVAFFGPKRQLSPQPPCDKIHKIDYVLISHNHYDHLDAKTVDLFHKLHPNIVWIVPRGVKSWFARFFPTIKQDLVVELRWWESIDFHGLSVTSVPAQHFSGRGLFDSNRSLWMGYVLQFARGKQLYFAGDTGYNKRDFNEIGDKFQKMDLSLLPIGVYSPRQFMKAVHVNPEESILIHQEVCSTLSIGGHWGTFRLSSESLDRPPFDLYCALEKTEVSVEEFRVLKPGQSVNW